MGFGGMSNFLDLGRRVLERKINFSILILYLRRGTFLQ